MVTGVGSATLRELEGLAIPTVQPKLSLSRATAKACWGRDKYTEGVCGGRSLKPCWENANGVNFICAEFEACGVQCSDDASNHTHGKEKACIGCKPSYVELQISVGAIKPHDMQVCGARPL